MDADRRSRRRRRTATSAAKESRRRGLPPESLDAITEFVSKVTDGSVDDDDLRVHRSHPLVLLIENSLEAISTASLRSPIVGLNPSSKERLVASRRKLERRQEREALQRLLFSFEQLCDLVQDVGYVSDNEEESLEFFTEAFPEWLGNVTAWAEEEEAEQLFDACDDALSAYNDIAYDIVVVSDYEGFDDDD
jgi:hypothetical protein